MVAAPVLAALAAADVGFRDSGELGTAGWVLGVPHPTGFPVDVLLMHAASLLPLGSIAFRQNVVIALLAAGALAVIADVALAVAVRAGAEARPAAVGAIVGVVALATWQTWLAAALAVEVYASAALLVALGAWLALRLRAPLPAVALLFGIAMGAHVSARIGL